MMHRARVIVTARSILAVAVTGCAGKPTPLPPPAAAPTTTLPVPATRAERTHYRETSHYTDVMAFLDSLRASGAPIMLGTLGTSTEGRQLPLVVLSRPVVRTPQEARSLRRPIVYVQANIHAGEVEGKEALLALLRDLSRAPAPSVIDSVVLVAVPIYNADGNEKFAAQRVNREEQNGPEMVGQRPNGQGLDLNRDYVKVEAPETRASLSAFGEWNPDLFVDLHTTDGSFHGYALTYAPPLNPAALFGASFTRDSLLPELRRRMRARHQMETFDYGNFSNRYGEDVSTDTVKKGWFSYDARPRFGTNYIGLRGGAAILSEAYSHDPFERRVSVTYAFVREILSLVAEQQAGLAARASVRSRLPSVILDLVHGGAALSVRSDLTKTPPKGDVEAEDLVRAPDSTLTEPGVPLGLKRSGHFRTVRIPIYTTFTPVLERSLPYGYILTAADTAAVRVLRVHGVIVQRLASPWTGQVQLFTIDSVQRAKEPFQGHLEARAFGHWSKVRRTAPAGSWMVTIQQPLAVVAFYLLEPESDDGLVTWNVIEPGKRGAVFPVWRLAESLGVISGR